MVIKNFYCCNTKAQCKIKFGKGVATSLYKLGQPQINPLYHRNVLALYMGNFHAELTALPVQLVH